MEPSANMVVVRLLFDPFRVGFHGCSPPRVARRVTAVTRPPRDPGLPMFVPKLRGHGSLGFHASFISSKTLQRNVSLRAPPFAEGDELISPGLRRSSGATLGLRNHVFPLP
jgi:hypothetical protein